MLRHMLATQDDVEVGVSWAAAVLPGEYAFPTRIANILESLGKPAAATYLKSKLPTGRKARSGDLGEIIGTHYATGDLGYAAVSRLRWKDHREMAMRGDDIIGVRLPETGPVQFLKGEAKSLASLDTAAPATPAHRRTAASDLQPHPRDRQAARDRAAGHGSLGRRAPQPGSGTRAGSDSATGLGTSPGAASPSPPTAAPPTDDTAKSTCGTGRRRHDVAVLRSRGPVATARRAGAPAAAYRVIPGLACVTRTEFEY